MVVVVVAVAVAVVVVWLSFSLLLPLLLLLLSLSPGFHGAVKKREQKPTKPPGQDSKTRMQSDSIIGALIICIGFCRPLYYNYNKEPPKIVLGITRAPIVSTAGIRARTLEPTQ